MFKDIGRLLGDLKRGYTRGRARHPDQPLVAKLYRGYRSESKLFVQGRVLEHEDVTVTPGDRRFTNFVNALRRLETDEIAGAGVRVTYRDRDFDLVTDPEGYFLIHEEVADDRVDDVWEPVTAQITSLPRGESPDEIYEGGVADLANTSDVAIVTDIDDTILQTGITSVLKLRAIYRTLADNAYTRMPFAGAPELFRALHSGQGPTEKRNPVFYLSNSPWNLYAMLEEFLDHRGFPKAPIFLRDIGLPYENSPRGGSHKELTLKRLLADFPTLQFVLIGDSGEHDADIYNALAREHPDRVRAVVIRNVKNNANARRIERMFSRKRPEQHFYIVKDSVQAARELARIGLIDEKHVEEVRRGMEEGTRDLDVPTEAALA